MIIYSNKKKLLHKNKQDNGIDIELKCSKMITTEIFTIIVKIKIIVKKEIRS